MIYFTSAFCPATKKYVISKYKRNESPSGLLRVTGVSFEVCFQETVFKKSAKRQKDDRYRDKDE